MIGGEMRALLSAATVAGIVVTMTACGTINSLRGGDKGLKPVSELWSDVPKMDGLLPSKLEPPLFVKVMMRTALNQIGGRGAKDTGDWIAFDSKRTPDDVKNFYSNQRMADNGWEKSDKSTCVSGSEYGAPQVGLICLFVKHSDKDIGLMIIPARSNEAGLMNVWFVRVEAARDSTGAIASKDAPKEPGKENGTNMIGSPAPYGIDVRPMPAGSKVGELLPGQVGPYVREGLRLVNSQNLKPEEIGDAIDGPIYADYRAGNATIFVELGIMYSVKDARESLDVAAGDAAGGVFPTDPRFGARGQEPSYLKVIDSGGAFFAWTRGNYYFSAHAKTGEAALDAFMQGFPF